MKAWFRRQDVDVKRILFVAGSIWALIHVLGAAVWAAEGYGGIVGAATAIDVVAAVIVGLCVTAARLFPSGEGDR